MAEQEESGQKRKSCCQECPTTVGTSICRFKNSQFFNAFLAACCPHTQAQEVRLLKGQVENLQDWAGCGQTQWRVHSFLGTLGEKLLY
jgi:hypothetical protein